MTLSSPDIERETYYHAVADPDWGADPRASLKAAVTSQLDRGADREHILNVLHELANELGDRGLHELEDAILDIMDAMVGWAHPSKHF